MMPRLFWDKPLRVGDTVIAVGDDGHHFARVLRAQIGERATIAAQGKGYVAVVRSVDTSSGQVEFEVTAELPARDARHRVYLIQAAAKADKVETIIQKCTEAGIAGVLLYESARSVAKISPGKLPSKLARWNKVAKEAAIQCQRDTIPLVDYAGTAAQIRQWLKDIGPTELLLLDEAEQALGLRQTLQHSKLSESASPASVSFESDSPESTWSELVSHEAKATVVVVGPEGGWDEAERAEWAGLGALPVTLGPRILRTETAGLVALAAILYEYGDLGG